ncbi:MAG: hypothetical protein AAF490_30295 [Chloroflexota bacterium]
MNNIDMNSVVKAGGIAAGVSIVLNILGLIPFIGVFFGILTLCFGIFIPIGGGMLYGYFAEGEEDTQTAAIGGALAGGTAGVISAIVGAVIAGIAGTFTGGIEEGLAAGVGGGIFGTICLGIAGFVLGAIGGAIWPMIQSNFAGRN